MALGPGLPSLFRDAIYIVFTVIIQRHRIFVVTVESVFHPVLITLYLLISRVRSSTMKADVLTVILVSASVLIRLLQRYVI